MTETPHPAPVAGTRRNTAARAEYILHELLRSGQVSVEDLSNRLHVDSSTIRRDLEKLERQNLLRRIHGGAVSVDALAYTAYAHDLTFQENLGRQSAEKARIALLAARMIQPGDTIALSPGTTTTQLARSIRHSQPQNLTVVTNAVNIATELIGIRGVNLILTGGMALPDFFALVGPLAEQSLREMYVDKAFLGMTGVSVEHGLTGPNQLEALTYRATLERTRRAILLADHTKLGRVALYRIAPIAAIHTLITDQGAPAAAIDEFKAAGVEVYTA
jgi:DeoR/GlpR family transcriptional regulator of sugar metabolism